MFPHVGLRPGGFGSDRLLILHKKPGTSGPARPINSRTINSRLHPRLSSPQTCLAAPNKEPASWLRYPVSSEKCLLQINRLLLHLGSQPRITGALHHPISCRTQPFVLRKLRLAEQSLFGGPKFPPLVLSIGVRVGLLRNVVLIVRLEEFKR